MELNITDISPEVQQAKARFGIIGNAPALIAAVSRAVQVSPIDLSVLVTGESGSGKEFFPQIIHSYSPRKHSRYIAVNCGAIPEGTIDSELFGHEKGAFTGAVSERKGYFEEANGGTIFLDEVAELPLTTQARLLRVLESGEFLKVGSSTVQRTNIRVVAATNVDMMEAVKNGRFREDLYYRLSTVQIQVPPLRARGNDILLLTRKFAADFSERYSMPAVTFEESACDSMLHYRWPGNVRQLKNVVEQISLFNAGGKVNSEDMRPYMPDASIIYTPTRSQSGHSYEQERELLFNMIFRMQGEIDRLKERLEYNGIEQEIGHRPRCIEQKEVEFVDMPSTLVKYNPDRIDLLKPPTPATDRRDDVVIPTHTGGPTTLEETERETIRRSLENNGGRRKATARELNISERTLYRKIKEYGLE